MDEIKIIKSEELVPYELAMSKMDALRDEVISSGALGYIWFLEHEDVFTIGTSGEVSDIIDAKDVSVVITNRGGKITYHGPGQRVIYLILNLKKLHCGAPDLRRYIKDVVDVTIATLSEFGIVARADQDNIGVWVGDSKIASVGVRIKNWVTTHGIAINISTNLERFSQIIPCGITDAKVCSCESLGAIVEPSEFDEHFLANFKQKS